MTSSLRIAWRNIWRNRTRTIIATSAISLSLALLLFSFAVNDGGYDQMLRSAERAAGGSVLVHGRGWWSDRGPDQLVRDPAPVIDAARRIPGVRVVMPRVLVTGLVSSSHGNRGVELRGVDPAAEAQIQNLGRTVKEGTFLAGGERRPIVLARKLAKELDVQLGDRVVLTATDASGEVTRALFRLSGIMNTGDTAQAIAYTTVAAAQQAMNAGAAVTEIGLGLEPGASADAVKAQLAAGVAPELEVMTWQEAMPEMLQIIKADKVQGWIFGLVIVLVVAFGIAETFLMSVMERVRELGLLNALGLTPARVARLILAETVVLVLFSTAVGLAIALGLHVWLRGEGLPLASMGVQGDMEMAGVIVEDYRLRSALDLPRWIGGVAMVAVVVLLSAVYPAWRASRLEPVEAMRTYE